MALLLQWQKCSLPHQKASAHVRQPQRDRRRPKQRRVLFFSDGTLVALLTALDAVGLLGCSTDRGWGRPRLSHGGRYIPDRLFLLCGVPLGTQSAA